MSADNFEEYNKIKEKLLTLLEESEHYFHDIGEEKQAEALKGNAETIRSGEFEVVVVGEFSAGKSTFLNAMMREKYLPSYTKETTATINYLRHSTESEKPGIVYYADGSIKELESIEGNVIEQYVSTKNKEMDVSKSIRHLDLFLESPFLENKVTLIDSPGLNGMKQGLSDITEAQIKRSHAVLFMFSAEQPGKRTDFEFLKKIKDEVKTVFLVLNKIDCIKESENQTVEDTIQSLIDNYKAVFPEDETLPEVIPIAAYLALVARSKLNLDYPANQFNLSEERKQELEELSRMGPFEAKLLHFLTNGEKTVRQIQEPLERVNVYLKRSIEILNSEMAVLENEQSGVEVEARLLEVQNKIENLEEEIQKNRSGIRGAVKITERNLLEYMDREADRIKTNASSKIEDLDAMERLEALDDELEFMNQFLKREIKKLSENIEERFKEEFFDQMQEQYNLIIDDLENNLGTEKISEFSFDRKLKVSVQNIHAGLEGFDEDKKKLEKQISDLEGKLNSMDVKQDELLIIADQAESLKAKIKRIQENQDELKEMYSTPPEIVTRLETKQREVSRKGFVGFFLDLFGKKTEDYSIEVKDDTERKAYFEEFKEKKQDLRRKQQEIEDKLEGMHGVEKRLEKIDKERENLHRQLQELQNKEDNLSRDFHNNLNQKYEKEIQRIKRKLNSQIEEYFKDAKPALKQVLKEKRNSYIVLLQDLLTQSINSQLEEKKKEYEKLEELKNKANYEKEELLDRKKKYQDIAQNLKVRTEALLNTVNQIEIDKIEYQRI